METTGKTQRKVEQVLHLSVCIEGKGVLQLFENKSEENSKKRTFILDLDGQDAELTLPGLKSFREMIDQALQIISPQVPSQDIITFEQTD
ncbi:hypothetical protein EZS27_026486 [termite gut metagenome]|uniref:Uncharacterized protein n=1 Tax=termite gut metagenome TaxID=433724 RepID=A0A5J4QSI5_9ZZZZ